MKTRCFEGMYDRHITTVSTAEVTTCRNCNFAIISSYTVLTLSLISLPLRNADWCGPKILSGEVMRRSIRIPVNISLTSFMTDRRSVTAKTKLKLRDTTRYIEEY
jgi:hypothetical protein